MKIVIDLTREPRKGFGAWQVTSDDGREVYADVHNNRDGKYYIDALYMGLPGIAANNVYDVRFMDEADVLEYIEYLEYMRYATFVKEHHD